MSLIEKWTLEALALTRGTAGFAKCSRRKVGAVLMDERGNTIATGRNGAAPGFRECLDGGCPRGQATYEQIRAHSDYNTPGPGFCVSTHAEANALLRAGTRAEGALLAITHKPCAGCVKLAAGARVGLIVWYAEDSLIEIESWSPAELLHALVSASA